MEAEPQLKLFEDPLLIELVEVLDEAIDGGICVRFTVHAVERYLNEPVWRGNPETTDGDW